MMTRVLTAIRGTFVSFIASWGILRSNVRTADIRLTSLVFVFGVSIPKPVVSGGSAHPTAPQPSDSRCLTFDKKSVF